MKRVFISVINDLVTDQRVHRVANLLLDQGMDVTCIGRHKRKSPEQGEVGYNIRLFRMLINKGPLFYACYNTRLFFKLLFVSRPSLFIANDLDTLPASYMAARIRGVKLIYDSHELFTQVPELIRRKRVQAVWKWIEYRIVPKLEHAVTVSYPIATIYRRLYGTRFRVVRNVPYRKTLPEEIKRKGDRGESMIIYQGALNVGRGLELMIETMKLLDDANLVIVGTGDIEKELKMQVQDAGLQEKVVFKGRMTPDELFPLSCSADLGISLEEDRGLNYRYALPNKLFDYIQCRVPVLCSDLPEMTKVVETYGIGIAIRKRDPQNIAKMVRFMLEERCDGAWRAALDKAAGELCWENESKEYLALVRDCGLL